MSGTNCARCHKPIRWPEYFCSSECRRLGAAAPMSMSVTVMRNRAPRKPTWVCEAEAALSQLRSADDTRRENDALVDGMLSKLALLGSPGELERRSDPDRRDHSLDFVDKKRSPKK
jgi:hypothetical protein